MKPQMMNRGCDELVLNRNQMAKVDHSLKAKILLVDQKYFECLRCYDKR